jgi:probable rRNA maturation factor
VTGGVTRADDPLVDLVVDEPEWERALPDLESIATRAAELALEAADVPPDAFTIALLACDDARIAALNAEFRGRPRPSNVLSWPAFTLAPAFPGARPARPPAAAVEARTPLGDVAIALQTVVQEAAAGRLPLKNHALHLILHGCLHLLGYDHERPEDAELMEGLERRALARAGIPDPYA